MKVIRGTIVLLLVLALTPLVVAQDINGSIAGTVQDASGAGVPGAKISITNLDQNQLVRTVTTDNSGNFSAPLLPVGKYAVTAEAKGFKKATQKDITLNVSD